MAKLVIGGETTFLLLPDADKVRVRFVSAEPSQFSDTAERWGFELIDPEYAEGDTEEVDEAIQQASEDGFVHYENVNIPRGKVGKGTKLYKYLAGMNGGDLAEDDEVDVEDFLNGEFYANFEQTDKMKPAEDGSKKFVKVFDDSGRPVKKATIAKLRPASKRKGSRSAPKPSQPVQPETLPEDDDDLDLEEDEA